MGQVSFENFGFPWKLSFHQMLHLLHQSSRAGTPEDLRLSTKSQCHCNIQITTKKYNPFPEANIFWATEEVTSFFNPKVHDHISKLLKFHMRTVTVEGKFNFASDYNLALYLSMSLQSLYWILAVFFSFLAIYTVGRTPWTEDQPVARPLPTHGTTQTQNKRTQTSISWVGFELTIQCSSGRRHCDQLTLHCTWQKLFLLIFHENEIKHCSFA
jgi:hypothetical protein